jgi:hypothetical protein
MFDFYLQKFQAMAKRCNLVNEFEQSKSEIAQSFSDLAKGEGNPTEEADAQM